MASGPGACRKDDPCREDPFPFGKPSIALGELMDAFQEAAGVSNEQLPQALGVETELIDRIRARRAAEKGERTWRSPELFHRMAIVLQPKAEILQTQKPAELGRLVRRLREYLDLPARQFAEELNVSVEELESLEAGTREEPVSPGLCQRLAQALRPPVGLFMNAPRDAFDPTTCGALIDRAVEGYPDARESFTRLYGPFLKKVARGLLRRRCFLEGEELEREAGGLARDVWACLWEEDMQVVRQWKEKGGKFRGYVTGTARHILIKQLSTDPRRKWQANPVRGLRRIVRQLLKYSRLKTAAARREVVQDLATRSDVDPTIIEQVVDGNGSWPSDDIISRMAAALGVPPGVLEKPLLLRNEVEQEVESRMSGTGPGKSEEKWMIEECLEEIREAFGESGELKLDVWEQDVHRLMCRACLAAKHEVDEATLSRWFTEVFDSFKMCLATATVGASLSRDEADELTRPMLEALREYFGGSRPPEGWKCPECGRIAARAADRQ